MPILRIAASEQSNELNEMLLQGRSMSGHERNCVFLNTLGSKSTDGRFATASAISGLDFDDDGQAACRVDWDHDGDLDLLLSNRNAPRIRFMRNNNPSTNGYLQFQLVGNGQDTNVNAIGARVTITPNDPSDQTEKLVKGLYGGDGYLSQSSRWMHFGLGNDKEATVRVEVRWPNQDGEDSHGEIQVFENVKPNQRYRVIQGSDQLEAVSIEREALALKPSKTKIAPTDIAMRIPLMHQFVAPKLEYYDYNGRPRLIETSTDEVVLLNLWSTTCVPCVKELNEFSERHDELKAAGIRVLALSVDDLQSMPDGRANSRKMAERLKFPFDSGMAKAELITDLEHLHNSIIRLKRALPMPTSFLIDRNGRLNTIYKGTVSVDTLLADSKPMELTLVQRYQRAAAFPGTILDNQMVNERMERIGTSALIFLGKEYVASRQMDRAIDVFKDALAQVPDSASINNELAMAYEQQGRSDLAIDHYRKALEIKPDNAALNVNVAQGMIRARRYDEAVSFLDEALRIEPENADAHFNRGVIYSTKGDVANEKACYEKAVDVNPNHAQALFRLGRVFEKQSDLDSAKTYYERALKAAPGQAPVLTGLARVLSAGGETDIALKLLREALYRSPKYADAHYELGRIAASVGKAVEAKQHFMRTLQLNRNHQRAMQALQQLQ